MRNDRPTAIFLLGPTASGKTQLAIELVRQLPCDIISVDSVLIYRGMNIGTAKPDAKTLAMAPHRLIDICDPAARDGGYRGGRSDSPFGGGDHALFSGAAAGAVCIAGG